MSLARGSRRVLSTVAVAVLLLVGGVAVWAVTYRVPPSASARSGRRSSVATSSPLKATCPLTGLPPGGGKPVPERPVAAVKVENTVDAYPLVGLQKADIIYEELVEGGLTRFMAVYQCKDAQRVGPVRSARTTDPKILLQFNKHPILGDSGAQLTVVNELKKAGILTFDDSSAAAAFSRAPAPRVTPHNLFVSVSKLYRLAGNAVSQQGAPKPVFTYATEVSNPSKPVSSVVVPFSTRVSGNWRWDHATATWVRQLNGNPMMLETGGPVQVTNVIVQAVRVTKSSMVDILGNPSPEVTLTGSGRAWILRDGRVIAGVWSRTSPHAVMQFKTKSGKRIPLAPGTTFVELMPTGQTPTFKK
ncbi:MAG: hypothetical protein QOI81_1430 [Actinomycetota bacterium]|nr:hypothetical protein [Actinomycetota bacterium]